MFSSSSAVRTGGRRWIVNESAPTSVTMTRETIAFMPWIRDTTVTIDATATMLPRTVMKDRSLFAQMDSSAITIDSRICCIALTAPYRPAGGVWSLTDDPSASSRTDAKGPVMTWSVSATPDFTSK